MVFYAYGLTSQFNKKRILTRFPKLAAIGVTTLSGLIFIFKLTITTSTITVPSTADASEAVSIAEQVKRRPSLRSNSPVGTQLNKIATIETRNETTKACHVFRK